MLVDEKPVDAVDQHVRQVSDVRHDGRDAAGERFHQRERDAFGFRCEDERARTRQKLANVRPVARECDVGGQAEPARSLLERLSKHAVPDDGDPDLGQPIRNEPDGVEQELRTFDRRQAPDKHHVGFGRQGRRLIRRRIEATRDHVDLAASAAFAEERGRARAHRDDDVEGCRGADQLLFDDGIGGFETVEELVLGPDAAVEDFGRPADAEVQRTRAGQRRHKRRRQAVEE